MKKHILKFIALVLILTFSACSDEIFDAPNKNNLTVENWYKTATDFEMALNSCYCPMADGGMFGLQMQLVFGTFDDRIMFESTTLDEFKILPTDDNVSSMFQALYFGVYRTSKFLEQIYAKDYVEGMTVEMRKNYIAQVKALRAAYYFYLVVIFNEPVFYNELSIPQDLTADQSNATPEQFWNQIEKDLTEAIPDLTPKSALAPSDLGRVTRGGGNALLGKAMLYKHYYYYCKNGNKGSEDDVRDLNTAKAALKAVIDAGEYHLIQPLVPKTKNDYICALMSNTSYVDLPSENNTYQSENNDESIWEVQYSDERINAGWLPGWQWSGALNCAYFSVQISSYKNQEVHPGLYYAAETAGVPAGFLRDPRIYAACYFEGDTLDFRPANEPYYNKLFSGAYVKKVAVSRKLTLSPETKYLGLKKYYYPVYNEMNAPKNDPVNRRVIRYADVLLLYAEVMHLLGDDGSGLAALNQVRARVDMPPVAVLTKPAIIHERDMELCLETHRFFDLVRWSFDPDWGIDFDAIYQDQCSPTGTSAFVVGKNEYLPIPFTEIDINHGKLKQNPNW
jgi:starch-binding outer membrane protein, SusD/RagB family